MHSLIQSLVQTYKRVCKRSDRQKGSKVIDATQEKEQTKWTSSCNWWQWLPQV